MPDGETGAVAEAISETLAEVPLFSRLEGRQLSRLAEYAVARQFRTGSTIVKEGDTSMSLYVVLKGLVRVERENGAVQVADCVPVLMADRRTGVAAAVHAGWRGTSAGITRAAVEALAREFSTEPRDLTVAIGPSIGACCYEVGDELLDEFRRDGAGDDELSRWFHRAQNGRLQLDLWTANREQLVRAGVSPDRIFLARLCTQTHAGVFDSYRAAGAAAGRMAALIRVP